MINTKLKMIKVQLPNEDKVHICNDLDYIDSCLFVKTLQLKVKK